MTQSKQITAPLQLPKKVNNVYLVYSKYKPELLQGERKEYWRCPVVVYAGGYIIRDKI